MITMKKLTFSFVMIFFCISCEKAEFDISNPDVETFVHKIKNGSYDYYEKGEKGENLWLLMPGFTKSHIQSLIDLSRDTSHIKDFPVNPVSSRKPFPEGRGYFILGECLLWTVEGIRNGYGYGSLDPYLIDATLDYTYKGVSGKEILIVRDFYQDWWRNFKDKDWKDTSPLDGKAYRWF